MICQIRQPAWPQFRFEWHPQSRKVYVIRLGMTPEIGEPFAHEIRDQGAAVNAVLIWLRGYKAAKAELAAPAGIIAA